VPIEDDIPAGYPDVLTATGMTDTDGQPGALGSPPSCLPGEADDTPDSSSNFATTPTAEAHTVAAPAVCVTSTYTGGGYAVDTGTSFAAPLVSGTVAICIASGNCAGLTPMQIIAKITCDANAYAAANPQNGFQGDPEHPIAGKYYGPLIRAALY
jgi:subtilisin family serine protease